MRLETASSLCTISSRAISSFQNLILRSQILRAPTPHPGGLGGGGEGARVGRGRPGIGLRLRGGGAGGGRGAAAEAEAAARESPGSLRGPAAGTWGVRVCSQDLRACTAAGTRSPASPARSSELVRVQRHAGSSLRRAHCAAHAGSCVLAAAPSGCPRPAPYLWPPRGRCKARSS